MKTKAQSALEYMMTYGWAILIIVIVAAVLYSLGIFNPSANAGTTATGFTPFTVLAQQCSAANGLLVQFGNNAGTTITWVSETITASSGLTATAGNTTSGTTIAGGSKIVKVGSSCSAAGSRYSASITVTYTESTSLGTQTLTATGTLAGTTST